MSQFSQRGGRRLALAAGILSVWALTACASGYDDYRGHRGAYGDRGQAQDRQEAARQAYERDLERRVEAALNADPRTKIHGLKVTSQGNGAVLISGSPANGVIGRDMALRAASRVPGVRSVANNMTVN